MSQAASNRVLPAGAAGHDSGASAERGDGCGGDRGEKKKQSSGAKRPRSTSSESDEGAARCREPGPFQHKLTGEPSMLTLLTIHQSTQTSRPLYNLFSSAVKVASCTPLAASWWDRARSPACRGVEDEPQALQGRPESMHYFCHTSEGAERWEEDADEGGAPDWEMRHPGDDPGEEPETAGIDNPRFQPITTKAAEELYSVLFAPPGCKKDPSDDSATGFGSLTAAYPWQLMVRVDPHRGNLFYDAAEWIPDLADTFYPVTKARVRAARKRFVPFGSNSPRRETDLSSSSSSSSSSSEDTGCEEEDGDDDGATSTTRMRIPANQRLDTYMRVQFADFSASRLLRCRLPLAEVVGLALHASQELGGGAVLVLELRAPASEFAARRIHGEYPSETRWEACGDWTPGAAASQATRHYISGGLDELRELAEYLLAVCPPLARLVAGPDNTLRRPGASLLPEAAPEPQEMGSSASTATAPAPGPAGAPVGAGPEQSGKENLPPEPGDDDGGGKRGPRDHRPLSSEEVVEQLQSSGAKAARLDQPEPEPEEEAVVDEYSKPRQKKPQRILGVRNLCLLAGIRNGHIRLRAEGEEGGGLAQVLHTGACQSCGASVECTLEAALGQPCCGGHDYADGDQEGAGRCPVCETGHYLSYLCCGKPRLVSGKFHNHCDLCPGFGKCIGDFRNAHCDLCGSHFFCGLSGFVCSFCGGDRRRAKTSGLSLFDRPFPAEWGPIPGALEIRAKHRRELEDGIGASNLQRLEEMLQGPGFAKVVEGLFPSEDNESEGGGGGGLTGLGMALMMMASNAGIDLTPMMSALSDSDEDLDESDEEDEEDEEY